MFVAPLLSSFVCLTHLCTSTACPGSVRMQEPMHTPACRGFKALKQVVKLHFKLQEREAMLAAYRYIPASLLHETFDRCKQDWPSMQPGSMCSATELVCCNFLPLEGNANCTAHAASLHTAVKESVPLQGDAGLHKGRSNQERQREEDQQSARLCVYLHRHEAAAGTPVLFPS